MSSLAVSSAAGSPISISGLASGLDTSSIISALMAAEREPVTRLTDAQEKLQGQQKELTSIQSSLQQLALAASEFSMPSLFESSQAVTSSEPTRVSAATSSGAGIGGYEVEVTQLANSAQRTFTFTSPAAEDTLTIDGNSFTVKAGESAKELANAINSDSSATVYAAVLEGGTLVLSNRATGNTGTEFIAVTDPGGTLVEKAGTAKEGKDAEYSVDGVAGTSTSNTVTNAIAGVTLTLGGLTTTGPVTIDVQPPGASVSAVEAQVQSFVKLYNSTVEAIQKQLATKPVAKPTNASEFGDGHPVWRLRTGEPARQHAPEHVRTDRRARRRNVQPERHRHQHRCGLRRRRLPVLDRRAADAQLHQALRSGQDESSRRAADARRSGRRTCRARSNAWPDQEGRSKRGSTATARRSPS